MSLTAFTSRIGPGQGRIASPDGTPGVFLFVLGEIEPGRIFDLAIGDHTEITQSTDLSGAVLVRALCTFRVPSGVPAGLAWEASITIDGMKYARVETEPGRTRTITDLAANVSKLTGVHAVGVRLELVTA